MRLFGHKPTLTAWIGMAIVGTFVFIAIFAPWLAPYGESEPVTKTWSPPSADF